MYPLYHQMAAPVLYFRLGKAQRGQFVIACWRQYETPKDVQLSMPYFGLNESRFYHVPTAQTVKIHKINGTIILQYNLSQEHSQISWTYSISLSKQWLYLLGNLSLQYKFISIFEQAWNHRSSIFPYLNNVSLFGQLPMPAYTICLCRVSMAT